MDSKPESAATVNVLSLFTGTGGLDLGLERAGMTVVGQVEIDPYCQRVLAKHWPEVPRHDDVRTCVAWWRSQSRPPVHLLAGGFPCQPVSDAGQKLAQADERWLWPAMVEVIDAIRPEWILWENVSGLLTRGLVIVHADLVRRGYRHRVGWASACAMGAPHARRRLFGIAHSVGLRCDRRPGRHEGRRPEPAHCNWWAAEPSVGRVAHGIPQRVDRIRGLGNAVVPQVAEYIGQLVMAADKAEA